jgi:DNA-binding transcriptional MerR regulator
MKLEELAGEAQVAPRTVRYYVQRGLLPAPEFRGRDTQYGRGHLLRLLAIKRLQQAGLPLDAIEARLTGASDKELERLGSNASVEVELPLPAMPARPPMPRVASAAPSPERWERVSLAPGLELHIKGDASVAARRIAREILDQHPPQDDPEKRS